MDFKVFKKKKKLFRFFIFKIIVYTFILGTSVYFIYPFLYDKKDTIPFLAVKTFLPLTTLYLLKVEKFLLLPFNKITKYSLFMDLVKYLAVSTILFLLGIWGIFLNRKNIIIMLMSIELMLLAVNLNFLLFSVYLDDLIGQLFALFVLTVAAAESAIGLALLVIYYRVRGTIAVEFINLIKG